MRKTFNTQHETPHAKQETRNAQRHTQNAKRKTHNATTKHKIQHTKHDTQNTKRATQSRRKTQNAKQRNAKLKTQHKETQNVPPACGFRCASPKNMVSQSLVTSCDARRATKNALASSNKDAPALFFARGLRFLDDFQIVIIARRFRAS